MFALKILGTLWALPLSLPLFILYIVPMTLLGWYKFHSVTQFAAVFYLNVDKAPKWLRDIWFNNNLGGHAFGCFVVLRNTPEVMPKTLRHELEHVHQGHILGIFHPLVYVLISLTILVSCRGLKWYRDNPLEVAAYNTEKDTTNVK